MEDTLKLSPKFIVPAVPTVEPLFFTTIPEPDADTPVSCEPSPANAVAVTTPAFPSFITLPTISSPPVTLIPVLAVIKPTESTFFTSSYVNMPPIETSPEKFALVAVIIPDEFIFLDVISVSYTHLTLPTIYSV